VKGDLFNSGLNSVEVATSVQRAVAITIAKTTSPTKGNAGSLVLLIDANSVASTKQPSSQLQAILYVLRKQVNFSFKKQNSNINLCSPFIKQLCGPVV
jgi:hypothetical protein